MAHANSGTPLIELRDISIPGDGTTTTDPLTIALFPGEVVGLAAPDGTGRSKLERDAEKWLPVFHTNHATTRNPELDDVSIKHHQAPGMILSGKPPAKAA